MTFLYSDFETTTPAWGEIEPRVWLWGILDDDDNFEIGCNIESFFSYLETLTDTSCIFFHNGGKFDFEFIKHYLGSNYIYNKYGSFLKKGEFNGLFESKSSTYGLKFVNKKGKTIYFKDSIRFFNKALGSMDEFSKMVVQTEFYDLIRNYKEPWQVNTRDYYYQLRDCRGVRKIIQGYFSVNKFSTHAYTSTGLSWKEFKKDIDYKNNYLDSINLEEFEYFKNWRTGGYTNLFEEYQQKLVTDITTWDENSLYPAGIRNTYMPVGGPIYGCNFNTCKHKCVLIEVIITCKLKKGFRPFLNKSYGSVRDERIVWEEKLNNEKIFITRRMLDLVFEYYHVKHVEIIKNICFESSFGIGHKFIDHYQEIKQKAPNGSAERDDAKVKQNGCYGRTTMDPIREQYFMRPIRKDEKVKKYQSVYGKYIMDSREEVMDEIMPIQIGIFILANTKTEFLIPALQKLGKHVVYCDTDSIHTTGVTKEYVESILDTHDTALGKWKWEGNYKYGYYVQRKFYTLSNELEGKIEKLATSKLSKRSFENKSISDMINKNVKCIQTRKLRVNGGLYIIDVEQNIKNWLDKEDQIWNRKK